MRIIEYQREPRWHRRRRIRRMSELVIPRNVELPICIFATLTAITFMILFIRWWLV